MPETAADLLLECLAEALQTFAFIAVEPADGPIPAPANADYYTLRFTGGLSGELQLAAPRALGCLMAANLLGVEPSDELAARRAQDVIQELCNIVTGLWLHRRCSADPPEMGLPTAIVLPDWGRLASRPGSVVVLAEGLPLAARMEEMP